MFLQPRMKCVGRNQVRQFGTEVAVQNRQNVAGNAFPGCMPRYSAWRKFLVHCCASEPCVPEFDLNGENRVINKMQTEINRRKPIEHHRSIWEYHGDLAMNAK